MRSLIYTSLLAPSLAFLLISPSVHATELLQTAKVACNPEKYNVSLRDAAGNIVASPAMLQNIVNRNGCEAIYSPSALEAISSEEQAVKNPLANPLQETFESKIVYRIPASLPVISGTLYHNGNQLLTGEVKPDKPEDYQAVVQQGERVIEVIEEATYTHILK